MKKSGFPTYLSQYKDSLMVASSEIEGAHGLPLDSQYLSDQLQRVNKAIKGHPGDNDINKNHPSSIAAK